MDFERYKRLKNIAHRILAVMAAKNGDDSDIKEWLSRNPKESIDVFTDGNRLADEIGNFDKRDICELSLNAAVERITYLRKRKILIRTVCSVAVAVLTVSLIVWRGDDVSLNSELRSTATSIIDNESVYGNIDKPTLILHNGASMLLGNGDKNIQSLNSVTKNETSINSLNEISPLVTIQKYNTLIVPNKYKFTVELSDGTKVILNANSRLIYPMSFNGNERSVEIHGEAYFDVAKSDIPFVVVSNGIKIRVYGTKFNVNNYNRNRIETTLISGVVGVVFENTPEKKELILKPNNLLVSDVDNHCSNITQVDTEGYISWLSGVIKSTDMSLSDLLNKLGRWYGVEFAFFSEDRARIKTGISVNLEESLDQIIESIEFALKVNIEKEEGGYMVY